MSNLNKFQYLELYNNEKYSLKYPNVTYIWDIGKCIFNGRDKLRGGSPDIAGLIKIGWDLKDIDELFYGISWSDYENDKNLVPQSDIDLMPMTIDKIALFKTTLKFCPKFDTSDITDMSYMFEECRNLKGIPILDTSKVTDMSYMFSNCFKMLDQYNFEGLFYIPLLNTSNVTNMSGMFSLCRYLILIPLLDTSKVTDMSYMFEGCEVMSKAPKLNTSNVINMSGMFQYCRRLTYIPQYNTSKVTNMSSMFHGCGDFLTQAPCLNISNVTDMSGMFGYCYKLKTVEFCGGQLDECDVTAFLGGNTDGSKINVFLHLPGTYNPIVEYCSAPQAKDNFNIIYLGDLNIKCKIFKDGDWLTGELNLTINKNKLKYNSLDGMYEYAVYITKDNWLYLDKSIFLDGVKIGELDFSKSINVIGRKSDGNLDKAGLKAIGWTDTDIKYLNTYVDWDLAQDLDHIVPLTDKDLLPMDSSKVASVTMYCPMFDTSQITDMSNMFADSYGIIPKLNTSNVINMSGMFKNNYSKIIPELDTSKVTNMSHMFEGTFDPWLDSYIIISKLNTINVTDMSYMFKNSPIIQSPLLTTTKVTNMSYMFSECRLLNKVGILDTSKVTNMSYMFYRCRGITEIEFTGGIQPGCNCEKFLFSRDHNSGTLYLDSPYNHWDELLAVLPSSWTVVYRDEL